MRKILSKATLLLALAGLSLGQPAYTQLVTGTQDFSITVQEEADLEPDTFSFASQTGVAPSTLIESAAVTITGINAPAPISVSAGGAYSVNGGAYTTVAGTILNGQTVRVRLTSSATLGATVSGSLTVGGVSGSFSVTTEATDTTPNAFTFVSQTGVAPSTLIESAAVTITGINAPAPISVSAGGAYSVNGGAYRTVAGTILNGQTVRVRLTSSAILGGTVSRILTIGNVSRSFSVTTEAVDTTPNDFSFPAKLSVEPSILSLVWAESDPVTITGINSPTPVSVSAGGQYSINGGDYTSDNGTILNGQTLRIRVASPDGYSLNSSMSVTVGGSTRSFSIRTRGLDLTADDFSFNAVTNAPPSSDVFSNIVVISGLEASVTVTVLDGASQSIAGGGFNKFQGYAFNGTTLQLKMTSSPTPGATVTGRVRVGQVERTFSVTTADEDRTPDALSFTTSQDSIYAEPFTLITFNPVTISGLSTSVPVSVTGPGSPSIRINNGSWVTSGTVSNGDIVAVRLTSSGFFSTTSTATITVGSGIAYASVTTRAEGAQPSPFEVTTSWSSYCNSSLCANASPTVTLTGADATKRRLTIASQSGNRDEQLYSYPAISINGGDPIQRSTLNAGNYLVGPGDTIQVTTWPTSGQISQTQQEICIGEVCQFWVWYNTR
jgi:hypothetical protein